MNITFYPLVLQRFVNLIISFYRVKNQFSYFWISFQKYFSLSYVFSSTGLTDDKGNCCNINDKNGDLRLCYGGLHTTTVHSL